jgi:hypothetical protein
MPKPNYAFEKRQRDMAKKQKNEEKRRRKAAERVARAPETPPVPDGSDKTK